MKINNSNKYSDEKLKSDLFFKTTQKVGLYASIIVIILGLIGNSIVIRVFARKRARINSSNVFMLSLALNNTIFLIIHLFEDSIRTYIDIHSEQNTEKNYIYHLLTLINITDKFDLACRAVNYLRYILRFISSYIIVAFTIQRLCIAISPLRMKFNSTKQAWKTVLSITILSMILNFFILLIFKIHSDDGIEYCDVNRKWKAEFFVVTIIYTFVIIVLPIFTIIASCLVILFTKTGKKVQAIKKPYILRINNSFSFSFIENTTDIPMLRTNMITETQRSDTHLEDSISIRRETLRNSCIGINQLINRISNKTNTTGRITRILISISISFVILNLPYMITWLMFFYHVAFDKLSSIKKDYLFGAVEISKIFFGNFFLYIINLKVFCLDSYRSSTYFTLTLIYYSECSRLQSEGY